MRILTIHNKYKIRGGEDESSESEDELLRESGHIVHRQEFSNSAINNGNLVSTAANSIFSRSSYASIRKLISSFAPDVVDVHNFFPIVSPSVFYACAEEGVPVVQTLHNYRLFCPGATLYRDGQICEKCVNLRFAGPAVVHKCYKASTFGSLTVASMLSAHKLLGTWDHKVTLFIALTEFCRRKFIEGGFDGKRIRVKPNFVSPDPGIGQQKGNFAVYLGRLVPEKGIDCLLRAWTKKSAKLPLKIIGEGPMVDRVKREAASNPEIEYLGRLPREVANELLGEARMIIFPSEWYEPFGRVIIEGFAKGTPIIAADRGASGELIDHGRTGWIFKAGDANHLASTVDQVYNLDSDVLRRSRLAARREFELKYSAERNLELQLAIFREAISIGPKRKLVPESSTHAIPGK